MFNFLGDPLRKCFHMEKISNRQKLSITKNRFLFDDTNCVAFIAAGKSLTGYFNIRGMLRPPSLSSPCLPRVCPSIIIWMNSNVE